MRFKIEQLKVLYKYDKMLRSISNNTYYGAVLSKKQKVLGDIYDQVADNRCSSCNNNWIKRLANWYVKDMKVISNKKNKNGGRRRSK